MHRPRRTEATHRNAATPLPRPRSSRYRRRPEARHHLTAIRHAALQVTQQIIRKRSTALVLVTLFGALVACGDNDGETAATTTLAADATASSSTEPMRAETTTTTTTLPIGVDIAPISCMNLDPCAASARIPGALTDASTLYITIDGWVPGQLVGAAQCADPDAYPGGEVTREASGLPAPPFCDLSGFQLARSDDKGRIRIEHEVVAGARMSARTDTGVTCDEDNPCVLSVFTANEGRFNTQNPRVVFRLEFS